MPKTKQYPTPEQQIAKLKSQNLAFGDEKRAELSLSLFGYFNLIKGYRDPYVINNGSGISYRSWKTNPYALNQLTDRWSEFLSRYRFPPYRFHDLRHFFASFAHARGVSDADILAAGGWKTSNVMQTVYRQSMDKNRAAGEISALIGS